MKFSEITVGTKITPFAGHRNCVVTEIVNRTEKTTELKFSGEAWWYVKNEKGRSVKEWYTITNKTATFRNTTKVKH